MLNPSLHFGPPLITATIEDSLLRLNGVLHSKFIGAAGWLLTLQYRASDLLQYVPEELRIASLDMKPPTFDFDEETARREEDALRTARGFFGTKEFARATFVLKDCKSSKARFLALYTKFLVSRESPGSRSCTYVL